MTEMKRWSISLPPQLEKRILELRKRDEFCRLSVSEIARQLLDSGLETITATEKPSPRHGKSTA